MIDDLKYEFGGWWWVILLLLILFVFFVGMALLGIVLSLAKA